MAELLIFLFMYLTKCKESATKCQTKQSIQVDTQLMRVTCYLPTGNLTASGEQPYFGGCASNREHLGDYVAIYDLDMHLIGCFKCNDTGGARSLQNGTSIDVFQPTMADAKDWIATYGDYCYVGFLERKEFKNGWKKDAPKRKMGCLSG